MFTLSHFQMGQRVTNEELEDLINNQNYTEYGQGRYVVGEIVHWSTGHSIDNISQLSQAPNGTNIYAREEYFGLIEFTKNQNEWFITSITVYS